MPKVIRQVYVPGFFHSPAGRIKLDKVLSANIKLLKCQSCGLLYKDLVPSRETIIRAYTVFGQDDNRTKWRDKSSSKQLMHRIQIVKRISKEQQHILDVGCGTGLFLRLAQQAGFRTSGLDPSHAVYAKHRDFVNASYYLGFLEDVPIPASTFDLITAWDVFEHFYDVSTALRKIYRGLKPGGYLLLETGNVSSFPAKLRLANNWWYISLLEHFNFFDESSIRYILNDMGFRVKMVMRTYHKSLDTLSTSRMFVILLKSLVFYVSPPLYRYLAILMGGSGGAAKLPWKDHILVVAHKS